MRQDAAVVEQELAHLLSTEKSSIRGSILTTKHLTGVAHIHDGSLVALSSTDKVREMLRGREQQGKLVRKLEYRAERLTMAVRPLLRAPNYTSLFRLPCFSSPL